MKHDGFKCGSGCFHCQICGKLTRQRDNNSFLCKKCEIKAEDENYENDNMNIYAQIEELENYLNSPNCKQIEDEKRQELEELKEMVRDAQ